MPHSGDLFQQKIPAAIYIGNGFGKLAGYSQVRELGNIETPVILTNTLSVPVASDALITYTIHQPGNENVHSVNAVVGETNDGWLNDIRGRHITQEHVLADIRNAKKKLKSNVLLRNDAMSPLFLATKEATEEAIINSLFAAETMTGRDGYTMKALPLKEVMEIIKKYNQVQK